MRRRVALVAGAGAAIVAVSAAATPVAAQEIELEHVATLGVGEEIGYVGLPYQLVEYESRYWVVIEDETAFIRVYNEDGTFTRLLGREGDGPGEFRRIVGISIENGVLSVVDSGTRRVTRIQLDNDQVETHRINLGFWGPVAYEPLPDGGLLLNGFSTFDASKVLHRFDREGRRLSSFDDASRRTLWNVRMVDTAPSGAHWVVVHRSAGIYRRDGSGSVQEFRPAQAWMEYEPEGPVSQESRPPPALMDVEARGEVVWLIGRVPAEAWEVGIVPIETDGFTYDFTRVFGSVIQAIDAASALSANIQ